MKSKWETVYICLKTRLTLFSEICTFSLTFKFVYLPIVLAKEQILRISDFAVENLQELRQSPDVVLGRDNSMLKGHSDGMEGSSYLDLNATGSFSLPRCLLLRSLKSLTLISCKYAPFTKLLVLSQVSTVCLSTGRLCSNCYLYVCICMDQDFLGRTFFTAERHSDWMIVYPDTSFLPKVSLNIFCKEF